MKMVAVKSDSYVYDGPLAEVDYSNNSFDYCGTIACRQCVVHYDYCDGNTAVFKFLASFVK